MTSVSGSGRTEAAKSRMSARATCVLPLAVRLEQAFERPEKCSQHWAADVYSMLGKRKVSAEVALDLGVGPSGDVIAKAVGQRVFNVVKPAHRIEIVVARLRVGEADVLVQKHRILADAEIVAD